MQRSEAVICAPAFLIFASSCDLLLLLPVVFLLLMVRAPACVQSAAYAKLYVCAVDAQIASSGKRTAREPAMQVANTNPRVRFLHF